MCFCCCAPLAPLPHGRFGKIAEAYEVLSDGNKRRMYDASLSHEWDGGEWGRRGGESSLLFLVLGRDVVWEA
jgi:DnaJ-class molecular chaperone